MSIPAPYAKVIQGLLDKSVAQKVVWDTTTGPNTFIVYFDKSSLSIRQDHGFNDETWIVVDLINDYGIRLDEFSVKEGDTDWRKINELYTLARRSALSIDNAIAEMLTELNKTDTIGQKKKNTNFSGNGGFTDNIPF
jgi:hypothetical protein